MKRSEIDDRVINCAKYYVNKSSTIREVANYFGLSKSQVHLDITKKLKNLDLDLYYEVCKLISKNKNERCIRGGLAIKTKYQLMKGGA